MKLSDDFFIPTNEFQTPINAQLLNEYPEEVVEQFLDFLENVEYLKRLISPNRKRAKDLPRDEKGRIIVDLANPHILEDMDYFRPSALHYEKYGCYTFLTINTNPNSEYYKWFHEEKRRCREGYIRPSDGEWVTGYMYYFLNYCPMMITKISKGSRQANRIQGFPEIWEGIYLRFHYLDQARKAGKHAIELARRGAHPYFQKVFTPQGWKSWGDINIGDELYATNNTICKVVDIPYDKESPYYKITLRDGREVYATDDHLWNIIRKGKSYTVNTAWLLQNYYHKRIPSYRIPSGREYLCAIPKNEGIELKETKTNIDAYTFGLLLGDGCFRAKTCYYTQHPSDFAIERPLIPYEVIKWKGKYAYRIDIPNWVPIIKQYGLYNLKSESKFIPEEYKYNSREIRLNVLKGLLDSDGYIHGGVPVLTSTSKKLIEDASFIARSLGYNTNWVKKKAGYKKENKYIQCLDSYELTIYGGPELFNLPRKQNKVHYSSPNAASRKDKTIIVDIAYMGTAPCKCVTVDSKDNCYLIGDFVTTHNCGKSYSLASIMAHNFILGESQEVRNKTTTILTAYQKEYLAAKDGTLSKFVPMIDFIEENMEFSKRRLSSSLQNMFWQSGYTDSNGRNKGQLNTVMGVSSKDDEGKLRGKRGYILFEEMGSFPNLLSIYDTVRYGVEEGDYTFGLLYLVGTSAEDASDFESAKTLLYSPEGYNILGIQNIYDRPKQGKPTFGYFFPAFMNRKGCYNENGVSDVVLALLQILMNRYKAKYSSDPSSVLRVIAEMPITPAEAIIKVKHAFFPTVALTERLSQLDTNPKVFDDVYTGYLAQDSDGTVNFKITGDTPIRKFGVDNSTKGCVEIFAMPEKNRDNKVYEERYIIGYDPVNNDQAESASLASIFVFDLFTDKIVAEYTGRQPFSDDNHEICRLLCLFYNAKCLYENNIKGCFAYFSKMQCTHLLADCPEYLRDKQIIKYTSWGSSAKGVAGLAAVNSFANSLIRDWLLKPMTVTTEEDGEERQIEVPTLYSIKNRALLEELIAFTPEINVDRIRALGMVMLLREEKIILYQGELNPEARDRVDSSYLGNDDFFTDNYDNR